jgi:hypothetical protein
MSRERRAVGLLIGAWFVAACSTPVSPTPVASAPPITSPSTSPIAIASPSPVPLSPLPSEAAAHLTWTKAKTNLPPRVANTGLRLAVRSAGSPRYVGVDAFYEVWTSDDAATWKLAAKDSAAVPGPWTIAIVPFGGQLVAFDRFIDYLRVQENGPYDLLSDGKTWLSTSGREWLNHPSPFAFVRAIVDGDRLVATGGVRGDYEPTFATSIDGVTWTVEPPSGDTWTGNASCWWSISDLAGSAADGYIVGAYRYGPQGTACEPDTAATRPLLWRSSDLRSWQPVLEPTAACARVYDVLHGERGFVAVGTNATGAASGQATDCAWVSRDGITWAMATVPPPVVTTGAQQLGVAPDGTFLAYGDEIWESTDGLQWYLSAPATNLYVYQVAGDLAVGCSKDKTCSSLRITAP